MAGSKTVGVVTTWCDIFFFFTTPAQRFRDSEIQIGGIWVNKNEMKSKSKCKNQNKIRKPQKEERKKANLNRFEKQRDSKTV